MADAFVQLPFTATTSGDLLDATQLTVGANVVKRERMVISNDASTAVALVTTSGALSVSRTPTSLTSGLVTLSSAIGISSGLISFSSAPTVNISSGIVTLSSAIALSSGLVTLSSAIGISSGLITLTGTNIVEISSGYITLMASSGSAIPATSSGGLLVTLSAAGSGSTAVNILGSTNGLAVVTSSGALSVTMSTAGGGAGSTAINLPTVSAAGFAPVTSSYGLQISGRTTGRTLGILNSTVGAPVTQHLTTAALWLYSITYLTTAVTTVGNAISVYSATSALSTQTPLLKLTNTAAVAFLTQVLYPSGIYFSNGLQLAVSLTFGTTGTNTAGPMAYTIEYEV